MTLKLNVTMRYHLSPTGQKAAVMSGRPATQSVAETVEVEADPVWVDACDVDSNGGLSLYAQAYRGKMMRLDAPPAGPTELLAAFGQWKTQVDMEEQERAERERSAQEAKIKTRLEAIEAARPQVLEAIEAGTVWRVWLNDVEVGGRILPASAEDCQRAAEMMKAKEARERAAREAEERQKAEAREALVKSRGGIPFPIEGGFCGFKGWGLWDKGQTNRWVGVFTEPRGVDWFLESPKGEFVWKVTGLTVGECVQGGGFSKDKRGVRSHETSWFGVVVEVTDTDIVIALEFNRADCMAKSVEVMKAADRAQAAKPQAEESEMGAEVGVEKGDSDNDQ